MDFVKIFSVGFYALSKLFYVISAHKTPVTTKMSIICLHHLNAVLNIVSTSMQLKIDNVLALIIFIML